MSAQRLNIYIWKTRFSSLKQYLFDLLPRNAKKTHTDQSILETFLLWLEKNVSQTFKYSSCKRYFPSVCTIYTTWLDECFLFHVITERRYFLYKFIVTERFGTTTKLHHSLKQVFRKKSLFYTCYPYNNIRMLLIPKIQNKTSTS